MIKECIYKETDKISLEEAAGFYYFQQMQGISYEADEEYAEQMETMMKVRDQEIGAQIPEGKYPLMESAMLGISAFKKKPVVVCDLM